MRDVLNEPVLSSGLTLKEGLDLGKKESEILISDFVDNYALICIIAELRSFAETECRNFTIKVDLPEGSQPKQECVTAFCARFLIDLYSASTYSDVFNSLENVSDSLPDQDYFDDVGVSNLDPLCHYKHLFLVRSISILEFHLQSSKNKICSIDVSRQNIMHGISLFSGSEMIKRVVKTLSKITANRQRDFLMDIRDSVVSYLELCKQTESCTYNHLNFWFTLTPSNKFIKVQRNDEAIQILLSWLQEQLERPVPPLKVSGREKDELKSFFLDQILSRRLIIADLNGFFSTRFLLTDSVISRPLPPLKSYVFPGDTGKPAELIRVIFGRLRRLRTHNKTKHIQEWMYDVFSEYKGAGFSMSHIRKITD